MERVYSYLIEKAVKVCYGPATVMLSDSLFATEEFFGKAG